MTRHTALLIVAAPLLFAQTELPAPTGEFAVGRTHVIWYDTARNRRPVRADIWYPAQKTAAARNAYIPDLQALLNNAETRQALRDYFAPFNTPQQISSIRVHSQKDAPFASEERRYPLLVFSPGLGLSPYFYTSQLEDFASHGYIVVALEHPEDTFAVVVSEGKMVVFKTALWDQHPATDDESWFYSQRANLQAADIIFAIDQLLRPVQKKSSIWHQRIDPTRIGAIGHSQGGRAAAASCLLDARIRACLNEDGGFDEGQLRRPYWPIDSHHIQGAFAFFDWFDPGISFADLTDMHTTLADYAKARLTPGSMALKAYRDVRGGSFRLTLLLTGMSHSAFTDQRYLRASNATERQLCATYLDTIRQTVRSFFDQTLGAENGHRLPCNSLTHDVLVQCYWPPLVH